MKEHIKKERKALPRSKRIFGIVALGLILFFLLISIVSTNQTVQNWYASKLSSYLSSRSGFAIDLSVKDASLIRGIEIRDLSIKDELGNTLIESQSIQTSLRKNLFSILFQNSVNLEDLKISHGKLSIRKDSGDSISNLQRFFKSFSSKNNSKTNCNPFNIQKIEIEDFIIENVENEVKELDLYFLEGKLEFDKIDLCERIVEIDEIYFNGAELSIFNKKNKEQSIIAKENLEDSLEQKAFDFSIRHFILDDCKFLYKKEDNNSKTPIGNGIDFKDLKLANIFVELRDISINDQINGSFKIDQLAFKENSGFQLNRMTVEEGLISNKGVTLKDIIMETPGSLLNHDLSLKYADFSAFKDFSDRVFMRIDIDDSEIETSDLFFFASKLQENAFFTENAKKKIHLKGKISGKINSLKGKDLDLVFDRESYLNGSFSSRNLTVDGEQLMNIRLESLKSNTASFAKLIPAFNFSESFHRMGQLSFKGSFDGYFHDFVAFGSLVTDMGSMKLDMRLDLVEGISNAEYSGDFSLNDFDLGEMFAIEDLGKMSLKTKVRDGNGLNLETVNADLDAKVDSVVYRNHTYRNIFMDGYLNKNLFNGDVAIYEDYIKMNLSGIINYGDSIPFANIDANILHADLFKLNINKSPLIVQSDLRIDLSGSKLDDIEGNLVAYNILLNNEAKDITLDSIVLSSTLNEQGERLVDLSSEIISFYFDGVYSLAKIPDAIIDVAKSTHPELSKDIPYFDSSADSPDYYYDFYIYIPDSKALFEIVQPMRANATELVLSGHIDHSREQMKIYSSIDSLQISNIGISNFESNINLNGENGIITVKGEKIAFNRFETDSIIIDAYLGKNQLNYNIKIDTLDEKLKSIVLSAITVPHKNGFETKIINGNIEFIDDNWYVTNHNRLVVGKEYIELENFGLINNLNSLTISDINDHKGIKTVISGFEIGILNSFLKTSKLNFGGKAEGFVLIPEIFKDRTFEGAMRIPDLSISGKSYGNFTSLLQRDISNQDMFNFSADLTHDLHRLSGIGSYDLKKKIFDSNFTIEDFPLSFLEHIIQDGISGTQGRGNGNIKIFGKSGNIKMDGEATVFDCATKVDYLGTIYKANNQKILITEKIIDFTGVEITDDIGNTAQVTGGINHNLIKNLSLNLSIESDKIKALSTTKKDNPQYYGTGIGSAKIEFSGPLETANISINAEAFKGSNLTIPVRFETEVSQQSFINFKDPDLKDEVSKKSKSIELTGMNLDMNLSIRQGAEIKIILNEQAGDHIQGKGTGDIRLEITRAGGFEMYGNYFINEGTYLFTALTLIQKPFSIRKGGKINWTGDPLNAQIDLMADYQGERVSLDNFIQEYTITNQSLAEKARKRTDVELLLHLTGSLLHPSVSFDLNFPNVEGEIKSYVFSKLQKLRSDQNLMYTQAVTLLSLGAFLPQDNLSGLVSNESGVSTAATGLHTGLQYTAVLMSKYLSGLFEEILANSSWVSGVDIDLNVINSQSISGIEQDGIWPNEYTYDAKLHLFEDKASFELSGSYVNQGILVDRSYANGDFVFKYYFTDDKKLRIEAYSKREFDEYLNEWKWKIGTGLNYQQEFGSIYDMKKDIEKELEDKSRPPIQ